MHTALGLTTPPALCLSWHLDQPGKARVCVCVCVCVCVELSHAVHVHLEERPYAAAILLHWSATLHTTERKPAAVLHAQCLHQVSVCVCVCVCVCVLCA